MSINPSIMNVVIENMIIAQREKVSDKKEFVLLVMRSILDEHTYIRYEPLISIIIDSLKALSKSDLLKNLKNKKCSCIK